MMKKAWLVFILAISFKLLFVAGPLLAVAQEKKALRVVFVSLSWNSEIPVSESLSIPQSILITRGEVSEKYPETTKRFLKALILGIQFAKRDKKETIKVGYEAGLKGDADVVSQAYDLYSPGYTSDLSIAVEGIQLMMDEDIRNGLVDKKMTVDKVINDRILKKAQEELRKEGRLGQ